MKTRVKVLGELARLTAEEIRELAKEAFFWAAHPVDKSELRYVFTQVRLPAALPPLPPPASVLPPAVEPTVALPAGKPDPAWPTWWLSLPPR